MHFCRTVRADCVVHFDSDRISHFGTRTRYRAAAGCFAGPAAPASERSAATSCAAQKCCFRLGSARAPTTITWSSHRRIIVSWAACLRRHRLAKRRAAAQRTTDGPRRAARAAAAAWTRACFAVLLAGASERQRARRQRPLSVSRVAARRLAGQQSRSSRRQLKGPSSPGATRAARCFRRGTP